MKERNYLLIAIACSFTISFVDAQSTDKGKNKTTIKIGAFYNSNLNYYGRTDSLQSSGFFPLTEIWFGNCFYINAAPVFTHNAAERFEYAGTVATAGYQAKSKNEQFLTHIYLTKPIYRSGSQLVQAALKEQLSGTFSWQNKFLRLSGGGDLKRSDKIDYGLNAGLDHIFRHEFPGQLILVADPSACIYAGTQQFTKTYYEKHGFLIFPGVEQEITKEVSRLKILSYELLMPVIISRNKLQLILIPAFVIPENIIAPETGSNMLYITAGVKLSL